MCQSTAAHTVDCERGNASEGFRACSHHPPQKGRCGPAPGTVARCTAARWPRRSYTAVHPARTPHAPPRPDSDASRSISGPGPGSGLTEYRAWMGLTARRRARADQTWREWPQSAQSARVRQSARVPQSAQSERAPQSAGVPQSARVALLRVPRRPRRAEVPQRARVPPVEQRSPTAWMPRLGFGEVCCLARSALSSARARTPRARV
jgi:hypothetical protein